MDKSVELKKIGCSNCGAELLFDPGTQMSNCNFCGSQFEIENIDEEKVMLPDGILPFIITKDQYIESILEWLSEGDYTPDDILEGSQFTSVNGLYLPMWLFNGRYSGNWSASSGYYRTEYYTEYSESQKKYVRRSRTVTDWRPSNGQVAGPYSVLSYAGDSEVVASTIATYAHGTSFKRGDIKNYDGKYTQGFNLLGFKKDDLDSWDKYGSAQVDAIVKADAKKRVPGDTSTDFYCDVSANHDKSLKIYVPFWITYYDYKGSKFYVHMDGTSTVRIKGVRPEDGDRKKAANKKYLKGHIGCGCSILLIILFSVIIGALEYTLSETESSIMGGVLFVLIAITSILYGIGHYQKLQLIKISKASRQETLKRVKQKKGYIQADNKTVLVAETSTKTTKKPTKTADKPIKESPVKATQKKSSAKKYILWGCLSISIVGIIIISMFAIGVYFATTEDGESTISVAEATDEYYENDEYNNVNDVVETPYDDVYNENDVVETPYEDEYYVETVSLLDFIVGNGFSELVLSQNSSSGVDNDLFSINIKAGKFRINVRNTYDLPNSYVLTQVSENEFFTVSKKITLISELLTLNNDLTTNPIAVDGQTGQFDPVTFSKGMKLDNIYETENYSFDIYGDYGANRGSSYLADLLINVGQPDEIKYTIAINKSSVNRKQNSNWYYLNELNGWILSDFCDVNQLTDNSMAIIDDSDGWSNVREAQTTKSSILFKIFDNEKFTIITNFGKWSLIEFNGDRGYISNSVIKLLE